MSTSTIMRFKSIYIGMAIFQGPILRPGIQQISKSTPMEGGNPRLPFLSKQTTHRSQMHGRKQKMKKLNLPIHHSIKIRNIQE